MTNSVDPDQIYIVFKDGAYPGSARPGLFIYSLLKMLISFKRAIICFDMIRKVLLNKENYPRINKSSEKYF